MVLFDIGIGSIDPSRLGFLSGQSGLDTLIRNLFFIALGFAGSIFFIMLIIGGFRYLTAGGDEKAAAEGQKTLTRAFIGLVIIIAAVLIVQLITTVLGIQRVNVT